jgi:serine/threonine protein kinase
LKKLGKYEVLGELGHGAMGVVYRARDPIINRLVALKTITTGLAEDPALLQRFYREAQSAGGLQHPNIVTIYDMGDAGALPYIAMELVEGENLEQLIARRTTLPVTLKLVYAQQALRAFDYAHKRGIVHRDIKPGNIMLSKDGTVKVVDFGIARVLETSRTQTGMLIGTFAYMSPEQYHGEHADERSDIWSFGVLLYELLTYQRPFAGATPASLMNVICNQEPAPLSKHLPDCPKELEAVLEKMLRKSPTERYQSMEDVLLDLEPVCKALQMQSVAEILEQSRQLFTQEKFGEARDLARQAMQLDSSNQTARMLLEKANIELRRLQNQPKAQQFVEKGQAFLEEGKLQEAKAAADSALQLVSSFGPAEELKRAIQKEQESSRQVAEWLEAARQNLVEGLPEEAESFVAKVLEIQPGNAQAQNLQQQVAQEKEEREKRKRLSEGLQQARALWTRQNYAACLKLLQELQTAFPQDEEVLRLLETVRDDQLEQEKQQGLLKARNLLAAGRHDEAIGLLSGLQKQFPADEEISAALLEVRKDQMNQSRQAGLAEARGLLSAGRFDECVEFLNSLKKTFPDEPEISELLDLAKRNKVETARQRDIGEVRKFLGAGKYAESLSALAALLKQYPGNEEILALQKTVLKQEAEQEREKALEEVRRLLSARRYEECSKQLAALDKRFPEDAEIGRLKNSLGEERAKQEKQQAQEQARNLLTARKFEEALGLLNALQKQYPEDEETRKLLESARKSQADYRKRDGLEQVRSLLGSRSYGECIALLNKLQADFPGEPEFDKLLNTARSDLAEQEKQEKLTEVRSLLAAQSFKEALALLDGLSTAYPRDGAIAKLRAAAERDQDKNVKAARIQQELDALKKLMGEKRYPEVISRSKELLAEFPTESNFIRLSEFAASRQANIDRELGLNKILDQARTALDAGRFDETIRLAEEGLKSYAGNAELQGLRKTSEAQQKKLQTRQKIEQRIREIRVKINREELSDAVDLAKQTLLTMGPDTDVTHLLNSAKVEMEAREKKRGQERTLETIRTLVETGDLDAASRTIDDFTAANPEEAFDPRIQRLAETIQDAKLSKAKGAEQPSTIPAPAQPAPPPLSKEYAFQAGPVAQLPSTEDKTMHVELPAPQGSVGSVAPPPVAETSGVAEVAPPPVKESVKEVAPRKGAAEKIPVSAPPSRPLEAPPEPVKPAPAPPRVSAPVPARPQPREVAVQPSPPIPVPLWRRPVVLAPAALVLILAVGAVIRSNKHTSQQPASQENQSSSSQRPQQQPAVNPLEVQQRQALESADKKVAANDLDGALQILDPAAGLAGPLTPEIQKRISAIKESKQNAGLRQLRQKEEEQWQTAMRWVKERRYSEAQKELKQILTLPSGGVHRDEAQQVLDKTIPQMMQQDSLVQRAKQSLAKGDFAAARNAAGQLQQSGGNPGDLTASIDKTEQAELKRLEGQLDQLSRRDDEASLQQVKALLPKFQALAGDGGPQSGEAQTMATKKLPDTIAEMQGRSQKAAADSAYQQLVQRYQKANDKNSLNVVRGELQQVAQSGGPHADAAQQYVAEIDKKLAAFNQPPAGTTSTSSKEPAIVSGGGTDEAEIKKLVQSYFTAYERRDADAMRQVWPGMPANKYATFKGTFELMTQAAIQINNESVKIGPDGNSAVISVQTQMQLTAKGEKKPKKYPAPWTFQMAKKNGVWFIVDAT